ncbi:MAG TPA: winged helix-turn-helix domain-containing protein [Thermoanaerobaculia bacterium]|nr:winged helix-turn-helix domain-containing protein [Thermoanaerobaculia bacterium]
MIRFGPFELDPRTSELRRDGELIPLAPQPFRLLLALASRPGELMTREELRQKVWDEGTFVDFERGLNFCILQVRTALGDDAKNPLYIETLPKRGYRFVGRIEADAGGLKPAAPRRWRIAAAAAGLVLVVFAIAWQRSAEPISKRPMVAVLPFDDLSASRSAYLADGMTEELITHLGRIHPQRLGVIARTSVLRYAGTKKNVRTIGRELGARYVVEGSVRREGDRVRVTAQLINADDQTHLWADSFDRAGSGALGIQEDVAARIARALRIEILDETALTARNDAAHEAYLRGRHLWQNGQADEAARELREAVRLEPGFVLAHIALAEAVHSLAMRERISTTAAATEIRRCSEAALRLAPSLAQSHAITAMLHFWYDWNWDAADESFRRAIELNPGEPGALHDHGWLLIARGAKEQGIAEIRRAQELDPVSPRANAHVAWAYIYTGRYDDAIREAKRALELSPDFHEADRCIEHASALMKGKSLPQRGQPRNAYETAVAMAMAQRNDQALAWLRRAKKERDLEFALAAVDPKLASLRGNAEFESLLITPRTR